MAPLLGTAEAREGREAICQHLRTNDCVVVLERLLNCHGRLPELSCRFKAGGAVGFQGQSVIWNHPPNFVVQVRPRTLLTGPRS